jgi:hypothetical protein
MADQDIEEIRKLFEEISKTMMPIQFDSVAKNLDIDLDEFDGYIMGFVSSFLKGKRVQPQTINLGKEFDEHLETAMAKLKEIIEHKKKLNQIALMLIEYLEENP